MPSIYQPFQPLMTGSGQRRFGLTVRQLQPGRLLANRVYAYLQVCAQRPTPYPVIPDGTQAVFISENMTRIGGARRSTMELYLSQPGDYFGICFYPGALRHFFAVDVAEITGDIADAGFLPCARFRSLHEKIYRHQNFVDRAKECEQWLLHACAPQAPGVFDLAQALIYRSEGAIPVSQLAHRCSVSTRHLNRLFLRHTGLGTKAFSRVIRIQAACRRLFASPQDSLAVSQELHYFDQAHLLRDYRQHLLTSPRALYNRFMSDFSNTCPGD